MFGFSSILTLDRDSSSSRQSVESFLNRVGMSRYAQLFLRAGYTSTDQMVQLSAADLSRMGVVSAAHCAIILDSIYAASAAYFV